MAGERILCEMTAVPGRVVGSARLRFARTGAETGNFRADAPDRTATLIDRPLSHDYDSQIAAFQSFHTPLLQFLKYDAFNFQRVGNTCTSLFFDRGSAAMVAFCATKCSSMKIKGATIRSLCPAVEIAALCVDDRYRFQGVGQAILRHVLQQVQKVRSIAGVQLVTLFAVPDAVEFYKKAGFKKISAAGRVLHAAANSRCVPMYIGLPQTGTEGTKDVQLILFP